jgi:hypothetical protein
MEGGVEPGDPARQISQVHEGSLTHPRGEVKV